MADQIITELPIKQQSGFNLNSYLLGLDADSYRILISDLAKKIVEDYSGSTLAGSAQAVKTALDSIDSTIGNTAMGTTATTITGAIAEHESDISQLNSKLLKYKDANIPSIAIGSGGYTALASYFPTGMANFKFATILGWISVSPTGGIFISSDGQWLGGAGGATVTNLKIRYWYTD